VAVGDFNADGDPDLAVANLFSGTVSVLLNTSLPAVSLGATSLAFADQAVGTIGGARSVTVTNTGDGSLRVSGVAVGGADASDFLVTNGSCTGERITKGFSCSLSVRFAPTALGARSATLRISSNDPASPSTVALSGTGSPPASGSAGATPPTPPTSPIAPVVNPIGGGVTPPPARRKGKLSARVTKADLRAPFKFTTSGRLTLPSGVAKSAGCTGRVSVQVKRGSATISTRRVTLRKDCTYSVRVSFANTRRFASVKRLKFTARFVGNKLVSPTVAPARFARIRR
jgi:hypothetical protein